MRLWSCHTRCRQVTSRWPRAMRGLLNGNGAPSRKRFLHAVLLNTGRPNKRRRQTEGELTTHLERDGQAKFHHAGECSFFGGTKRLLSGRSPVDRGGMN